MWRAACCFSASRSRTRSTRSRWGSSTSSASSRAASRSSSTSRISRTSPRWSTGSSSWATQLEVGRSGANLAGPALAGGLVGLVTAPYAILVDSVSFSSPAASSPRSASASSCRRSPPRSEAECGTSSWRGLRYVVTHPLLRPQAMSTRTSNFFTNVAFSIFLVFAVRELDMSAALIGLAFGLGNVEWLLGALSRAGCRVGSAWAQSRSRRWRSLRPPCSSSPSRPHSLPFLVAGGILGGIGMVVYNIAQVSLRQAITPERMQGRMNAVMRFIVLRRSARPAPRRCARLDDRPARDDVHRRRRSGARHRAARVLPDPLGARDAVPVEVDPTIAAGEGALAGAVAAGADTVGATTGAGAATARET